MFSLMAAHRSRHDVRICHLCLSPIAFIIKQVTGLRNNTVPSHRALSNIMINPSKPSGHYMYHQFNIHKFHVLLTLCICVFCVDQKKNSDYFPIQHQLAGLYNRYGVCLLRGADWVFIYNSG
jgi:hypothetical protein